MYVVDRGGLSIGRIRGCDKLYMTNFSQKVISGHLKMIFLDIK